MSFDIRIIMNIISANKEWLVKKTITITSGVYAALSMIALWVDFTGLCSRLSPIIRIVFSVGMLAVIAIISFISCWLYLKYKKFFTVFRSDNGHTISVEFGDILDIPSKHSVNSLSSTVIPVNRCFDTIVDDKLVARSSLHGKFLSALIANNHFSPESLNRRIQLSLSDEPCDILTFQDKPAGNLKRFPAGTIVKIDAESKQFFLLGLSRFNKDLKAITSKEDYIVAIQKLIEYCDSYAQGGMVFLPLIGTGLSRVGVTQKDAFSYLYHTIVLNKEHLSFDITIVMPDAERGNISITNN